MTKFSASSCPITNFEYEKADIKKIFEDKFLGSMLQPKDTGSHIGSVVLSRDFLENNFPKLSSSIKKFTYSEDNIFGRFFITLPNSKSGIHVDTQKGGKHHLRNLALNIPINGCQGTYHQWFNMGEAPCTDFKHSAFYWSGQPDGELIGQCELLVPTILRVSVPHRTFNPLNSYRIVLSIRTESDTFNTESLQKP